MTLDGHRFLVSFSDSTMSSEHDLAENERNVNVVQDHRASTIIPIVLFSYIGVLVRLGLAFLVDGRSPLSTALWSNLIGCIVMGFVVEQKLHIQHQ